MELRKWRAAGESRYGMETTFIRGRVDPASFRLHLVDLTFDVGELLGSRTLGIGRDVFVAGSLNHGLDRGFDHKNYRGTKLIVALTADEEEAGIGCRRMVEEGLAADGAVVDDRVSTQTTL